MKLGLERVEELAEKLGNPQNNYKIIHVAGSNGKGSTVAMIASVLRSARRARAQPAHSQEAGTRLAARLRISAFSTVAGATGRRNGLHGLDQKAGRV